MGLFFLLVHLVGSPVWAAESPVRSSAGSNDGSCETSILHLGEFESRLQNTLPRCVVPSVLGPWLKEKLLQSELITAEARGALESGLNPLLFSAEGVEVWQQAYRKFIEDSSLTREKKASLITSLNEAAAHVRRQAIPGPLWALELPRHSAGGREVGRAPKGGSASPASFLAAVDKHLKDTAFRSCLNRTGRLFVVSNIINTGGALLAHWSEYAGEDRTLLRPLFAPAFWQRAFADERFVHNISWNALLMAGLAGFSCLHNQSNGHWLLTGVGLGASLLGQATLGGLSLRQTAVDTLFVHFISYYKAKAAVWAAENYQRRGLPQPQVVEALLYTLNEGVGALGYPMVDDFSRNWCGK